MSYVIPRPVVARTLPLWGPVAALAAFPGEPSAPGRARLWAARRLTACGRPWANLPDLADALRLVVSELTANAVAHTRWGQPGGHLLAALHFPHDRVALTVEDLGPRGGRPHSRAIPAPPDILGEALLDESGRGLALVALHSARYGWTACPHSGAHTVWCELPAPDQAA